MFTAALCVIAQRYTQLNVSKRTNKMWTNHTMEYHLAIYMQWHIPFSLALSRKITEMQGSPGGVNVLKLTVVMGSNTFVETT